MWQHKSSLFRTRLTAVILVTTVSLLPADDKPVAPNGYTMVPFKSGDKTTYIQVKNQATPFSKLDSDDQKMFSRTSSFANKDFSFSGNGLPATSSALKDVNQSTFITKPYAGDTPASPFANLNARPAFAKSASSNQTAAGFNKSYFTSSDSSQNHAALFPAAGNTTAADQNRTAVLGHDKPEVLSANSMANKQYLGPGAQHVPDDVVIPENIILTRMNKIPNRPLSIDEVRDLINHGTSPNTDIKPAEPSRPLNDPDYKPEPLRDSPIPSSGSDDDKDDPVPPPGTMAAPPAPENSEPLPQR